MKNRRGSLLHGTMLGNGILGFKVGDSVKPVIVNDMWFVGTVQDVDLKTNKITVSWNGALSQHDSDELMVVPALARVASRRTTISNIEDIVDIEATRFITNKEATSSDEPSAQRTLCEETAKCSSITAGADITDKLMQYEMGEMDDDEVVEFFQELIDSGMINHLQGNYGRMAANLIRQGLCHQRGHKASEKKATGELSMSDIQNGGWYSDLADDIKDAAMTIQRLMKNKVRFLEMVPNNSYQGPYAQMSTGKLWSGRQAREFRYEFGMGQSLRKEISGSVYQIVDGMRAISGMEANDHSKTATGEMSRADILPGGEYYETATLIKEAAKQIQRLTKNKVMFIEMRPFDVYQGPYAKMSDGRLWGSENDDEFFYDARITVKGEVGEIAKQILAQYSVKASKSQKYKGYTIEESGDNFSIIDPSGKREYGDVPATVETAKKWIDMAIRDKFFGKKASVGKSVRLTPSEIANAEVGGGYSYTIVRRPQSDGRYWVAAVRIDTGSVVEEVWADDKDGVREAVHEVNRWMSKMGRDGLMSDSSRTRWNMKSSVDCGAMALDGLKSRRSSLVEMVVPSGTDVRVTKVDPFGAEVVGENIPYENLPVLASRRGKLAFSVESVSDQDFTGRLKKANSHFQNLDEKGRYMLLGRLQQDAKYFIQNPSDKYLWSGNVDDHIADMKKLYDSLPQKPEWITMRDIWQYEQAMKRIEKRRGEVVAASNVVAEVDLTGLPSMSIDGIASIVSRDWKNVFYGAKPYLSAMYSMNSINDNYGEDSGKSIIAYFLSNATTWRGDVAKAVKSELNKRLKRG